MSLYVVIGLHTVKNTLDALFYAILNFTLQWFCIKLREYKITNVDCFIIIPNSLHLSEKLKRYFKIREIWFLRFYADINSSW